MRILIDFLEILSRGQFDVDDQLSYFTATTNDIGSISSLRTFYESHGDLGGFGFRFIDILNNEPITDEFEHDIDSLKVNLNKEKVSNDKYFFFSINDFVAYLKTINPLDLSLPFSGHQVFFAIGDLDEEIKAKNINIVPLIDFDSDFEAIDNNQPIPSYIEIQQQIKFHCQALINPNVFYIDTTLTGVAKPIHKQLNKLLCLSLLATLTHEIFSSRIGDEVLIKGNKRIEIPLYNGAGLRINDRDYINKLLTIVSWVYERNDHDLRLRIFARQFDDKYANKDYVFLVAEQGAEALVRAQDAYFAVIAQRIEEFDKEYRTVLTEVSNYYDQILANINSFIRGTTRDFLASLFLLGVNWVKLIDTSESSVKLDLIAKLLPWYFIGSLILQLTGSWYGVCNQSKLLKKRIEEEHYFSSTIKSKLDKKRKKTLRLLILPSILLSLLYGIAALFLLRCI
ncbi:hypothetical protein [Persicobacter sp. CCB-QB2]|uniref:hypothetical protein n=1 Tax=Persicobacter sp. CCB-QB2 TaxID=1561025 RepID=UPI0006A9934F|nr:hypothetical protein [Persicobacter sp. CCB-QB2]